MPQPIVSQIHKLLLKKQKSLAVAESCTAGLVSKLLTDMPSSSAYFLLGVTAYANRAKEDILKIPRQFILKKGAVSQEVAQKMAGSVRKIGRADFGVGITGIAGPAGATPEKPVGTVFIAIDKKGKKTCKRFIFKGSRLAIRKKAALKSLELLKGLV